MAQVNQAYKDRLFTFIFGQEENREWTLSLYNAVNGSQYTDASAISKWQSMPPSIPCLIRLSFDHFSHNTNWRLERCYSLNSMPSNMMRLYLTKEKLKASLKRYAT